MGIEQDWVFLRDTLRGLDKKVVNDEIVAGEIGPPWNLPADLTGPMAHDYLEAAKRRFETVEKAVKEAWESPIVRVADAARDVASRLREGAKRAAKIAKAIVSATGEFFEQTIDRMEKAGESVATGLGMGAAFAIIVGLLLASRALGK